MTNPCHGLDKEMSIEPLHARIPGHFDSWRNILTGECRRSIPSAGELDWVRSVAGDVCSDAVW